MSYEKRKNLIIKCSAVHKTAQFKLLKSLHVNSHFPSLGLGIVGFLADSHSPIVLCPIARFTIGWSSVNLPRRDKAREVLWCRSLREVLVLVHLHLICTLVPMSLGALFEYTAACRSLLLFFVIIVSCMTCVHWRCSVQDVGSRAWITSIILKRKKRFTVTLGTVGKEENRSPTWPKSQKGGPIRETTSYINV